MLPLYAAALNAIPLVPGTTYLDVGCGSGLAAELAASLGARVSGVDASEPLLRIARERTLTGDFRVADIEAIPFDSECFDVVACFESALRSQDPAAVFAEARRVVRAEGVVVVSSSRADPVPLGLDRALRALVPAPAPDPFRLSDPEDLQAALRAASLAAGPRREVRCRVDHAEPGELLGALLSSGLGAAAIEAAGEEEAAAALRAAAEPARTGDGGYSIESGFDFVICHPV